MVSVTDRMLNHLEIWLGAGLPLARFRTNYAEKYNGIALGEAEEGEDE